MTALTPYTLQHRVCEAQRARTLAKRELWAGLSSSLGNLRGNSPSHSPWRPGAAVLSLHGVAEILALTKTATLSSTSTGTTSMTTEMSAQSLLFLLC